MHSKSSYRKGSKNITSKPQKIVRPRHQNLLRPQGISGTSNREETRTTRKSSNSIIHGQQLPLYRMKLYSRSSINSLKLEGQDSEIIWREKLRHLIIKGTISI